ncbi:MAG: hypothetical protein ACTSRP_19305, partial [Candidatus Helarchaeota archaeon]
KKNPKLNKIPISEEQLNILIDSLNNIRNFFTEIKERLNGNPKKDFKNLFEININLNVIPFLINRWKIN